MYFENNRIELSSLVGSLEFLFSALESVENEWGEKFLKAITTLEHINAIEIIKEAGEEVPQIDKDKVDKLINIAVSNLKILIEKELNDNSIPPEY